jgi:hypothetical protein
MRNKKALEHKNLLLKPGMLLILCFTLALLAVQFAAPAQILAADTPYTDISSDDWFYNDALWAYENDLFPVAVNSSSETLFAPNEPASRAMLVTALFRLIEPAKGANTSSFEDVPLDQWYSDAIAWAEQNSIVNGISDTLFAPDANISRQAAAAVFHRVMMHLEISLPLTQQYIIFKDEDSIASYAKNALQDLYKLGVINGYEDNSIGPKLDITKAQLSAMLHRFSENVLSQQ